MNQSSRLVVSSSSQLLHIHTSLLRRVLYSKYLDHPEITIAHKYTGFSVQFIVNDACLKELLYVATVSKSLRFFILINTLMCSSHQVML